MTLEEYQQEVMRTCGHADFHERLMMSAMGLAGEVGEVNDILKKHLWHGHNLDHEKLKIEIGDVAWYLTLLCNTLEMTLEEVLEANIQKLKRRYPAGFSSDASKNREG